MAKNIIKKSSVAPTILISAGKSFLSLNLVKELINEDAQIICIDSPEKPVEQQELLKELRSSKNFTFLEHDINNNLPSELESVDFIFHLSNFLSYNEKNKYKDSDINYQLLNANGTKNLLTLAEKSDAKFLLVSSIDIYQGLISSISLDHYFGVSESQEKKFSGIEILRFSEALVWESHKRSGLNARIARISNIYGPGMDLNPSISLSGMIKSVLENSPLIISGDGLQKEYYLYITDSAEGLVKAMFTKNTNGKIYPISPAEPITTLELAYLLKSVSKKELRLSFKKDESFLFDEKKIETSLQRQIDFSVQIDLKEGLRLTLDSFGYKEPENSEISRKGITTIADKNGSPKDYLLKKTFPRLTGYRSGYESKMPDNTFEFKDQYPPLEEKEPLKQAKKKTGVKSALLNSIKLIKSKYVYLSILSTLIIFFTATAILPLFTFIYFSFSGIKNLNMAKDGASSLNLSKVRESSFSANKNFEKARRNLEKIYIINSFKEELKSINKLINIGSYVSISLENLSGNTSLIDDLYKNLSPNQKEYTLDEAALANFAQNVELSKIFSDLAFAEMESLNINKLPKFLPINIESYKNDIRTLKESLEDLRIVAKEAVDLLGYSFPKKYLILLQNPAEIRAGGGFIGSYALLTISKGKISDLQINDIYNLDGLLDEKNFTYPPPDPLKETLKLQNLRIRDANWYADFNSSAETIKTLFESATSEKLTGIIAINLFAIEDLLDVTGEVFLSNYSERINSENLYEKAQYQAEERYFEGSQKKKTFLTELNNKIVRDLFEIDSNKLPQLLTVFSRSLSEKNILLYLNSFNTSDVLYSNNWDGRLVESKGDYLYIIDSNLGTNKANFEVTKNVSVDVKNTRRDGSFEVDLTLTYIHKGKERSWPGGPYLNYLRVLVPNDSFLHSVVKSQDSPPAGGDEKGKDITDSIRIVQEGTKRSFETQFLLNPGRSISIRFNYSIPLKLASVPEDQYSLLIQKQPGTKNEQFTLTFKTPFGKTLTKIPEDSEELIDGIKLPITLNTNKYVSIEFE